MKNFREKLKIDNIVSGIGCAVLLLFCFLSIAGEAGLLPFFTPAAGDSHWQSQWRGFILGSSTAVFALMLFGLIRNIQALRNEEKLKKLYIKVSDERTIQVQTSAQAAGLRTALILGIVAVVVSGYWSVTVSMTIMVCVLAVSLITVGFKLYYHRKL